MKSIAIKLILSCILLIVSKSANAQREIEISIDRWLLKEAGNNTPQYYLITGLDTIDIELIDSNSYYIPFCDTSNENLILFKTNKRIYYADFGKSINDFCDLEFQSKKSSHWFYARKIFFFRIKWSKTSFSYGSCHSCMRAVGELHSIKKIKSSNVD